MYKMAACLIAGHHVLLAFQVKCHRSAGTLAMRSPVAICLGLEEFLVFVGAEAVLFVQGAVGATYPFAVLLLLILLTLPKKITLASRFVARLHSISSSLEGKGICQSFGDK